MSEMVKVTEASANQSSASSEVIEVASRSVQVTVLAAIMLVSCATNIVVTCAIFQSKIRYGALNVTIANLSAVCLCDCLLNMSVVMGSLVSSDWSFGEEVCKLQTFVMNLVLVETLLLLLVLTCDRYLAARLRERYTIHESPACLGFVIAFTWTQSISFSVPFSTDVVQTIFRAELHTCLLSLDTHLAFVCVVLVLCFLAPVIIIVVLYAFILHLAYKQKQLVRSLMAHDHYTEPGSKEPHTTEWQEMLSVRYTGAVCILWFVLEAPYIVTTYIQQYRFSKAPNFSVEYSWRVDLAFIWMRFSYSAIFPCCTLFWRKDLWRTTKACIVCHKNNSVVDIGREVAKNGKIKMRANSGVSSQRRVQEQECHSPNALSFNIPVLFATSDGIHIETPHSDFDIFHAKVLSTAGDPNILKGRTLDVYGPDPDYRPLPDCGIECDCDSHVEADDRILPISPLHLNGCHFQREFWCRTNMAADEDEVGKHLTKLTSDKFADSGLGMCETAASSGLVSQKFVESPSPKFTWDETRKLAGHEEGCNDPPTQQDDMYCQNNIQDAQQTRCTQMTSLSKHRPNMVSFNVDYELTVGAKLVKGCNEREDLQTLYKNSSKKQSWQNMSMRLKSLSPQKKNKVKKNGRKKRLNQEHINNKGITDALETSPSGDSSACSAQQLEDKGIDVADGVGPSISVIKMTTKSEHGHKRSSTSDSQKSLMGSSSSSELNNLYL